jgi:phospholipase/carboxylesterase
MVRPRRMPVQMNTDLDVLFHPSTLDRADFVMIGLHGRDADSSAFFPFVRQMGFLHTRWVLPRAPFPSPAPAAAWRWFTNDAQSATQIAGSRERLTALLNRLLAGGASPENVFLVGFSQGAVMALDTALRFPIRLGGVVALSGYVAHPDLLARERHSANARLPIFIAHGVHDTVLTIDVGRRTADVLRSLGYAIDYHEYEAAHRIAIAEVRDIRAFLHRHMYGMAIDDIRADDDHVAPF